jgi:TolA-binding protein
MLRRRRWIVSAVAALAAAVTVTAAGQANEEVARRQLESGRAFAQQGRYNEALKDFRAVAETHSTTSVADNAWLEIARYYLDVGGNTQEAQTAVESILKKYPTSDSAPDAHLMFGRLALARGRTPADLDEALANFARVLTLFPASDAVPRALVLTGETLTLAGRLDDALASLARVQVEYSAHESAADAYLAAGRVLVALGDPLLAMEEMQQSRNRWAASRAAATALSRISLLHRLYVRTRAGAAYAAGAEAVGPAKIQNVQSIVVTPRNAVYWASESGVGIVAPTGAEKPPGAQRPRLLTVSATGQVFVVEGTALRAATGDPISLMRPRSEGEPEPLEKVTGVVQLSTGDWLVADENTRAIHKYSKTGEYGGPWAQVKAVRLAINAIDQVAALDRDQKAVITFDRTGKEARRLPLKGQGYVFENPVDVAFDVFGHLYVLDRESLGVFSPYPASASAAPPAAPAPPGPAPAAGYRLLTLYSELADKSPTAFRRATALAVDQAGVVYLADDRAQRIRVYR